MSITESIIGIVAQRPGLTAEIIQEELGIRNTTCKAALWRLWKDKRVYREKVKIPASKGPQSVYAYSVASQQPHQEVTV